MAFVVMDIAKSYEVIDCILASVSVLFCVVKFKHFSRVIRREHFPMPSAIGLDAFKAVAL